MKKIIIIILCPFTLVGCKKDKDDSKELDSGSITDVVNFVKATIKDKEYLITLEDNETVDMLLSLLPQEYNMEELNGNELYIFLDDTFPTDAYNPKNINKGDVMLYGNNCLVIFYEDLETTYNYTKIGHIDNLPEFKEGEKVLVKITSAKEGDNSAPTN